MGFREEVRDPWALVLAGGVYFTWSNLRIAQQSLRATEQKLDVDRQGQITSRFTEAVGPSFWERG